MPIQSVPITGGQWTDLYAAIGETQGLTGPALIASVTHSTAPVVMSDSVSEPTDQTEVLKFGSAFPIENKIGDGYWVYSAANAVISVVVGQDTPRQGVIQSDVLNSPANRFRRTKVELWRAAIDEAREFRMIRRFQFASGSIYYKFTSAVPFVLTLQRLAAHSNDVEYKVYRAADVTDNGGFTTPIPTFARNTVTTPGFFRDFGSGKYVSQVTIMGGGTITLNNTPTTEFDGPQDDYVDYNRVKISSLTFQQSTISGGSLNDRQLDAGDYYIEITELGGAGDCEGHFELAWEEVIE